MPKTMTRLALLDKVRQCSPGLGWDDTYPYLFGKYGMTICGICDGWRWFEVTNITDAARNNGCLPLDAASDAELLEMFAITQDYWLKKYEEWLERAEEKIKREKYSKPQTKTIMSRLIDAGYPRAEMANHETDLYVFATPVVYEVLEKYKQDTGISPVYSSFIDQVSGKTMLDIAWAYDPEWERKMGNNT